MDTLELIGEGFATAFTFQNITFVLLGVVLGTAIGLLPGIGSITGVALLLPLTLGLDPLTGLITLAGIYYGALYGGSTTAILISTPGDPAQVMTTLDGYQLARQGRAGPALLMSALASWIAGTITIPLLMVLAPILSNFALDFGPPEQFALMLFGLASLSGMGGGNRAKGLAMAALGVALATIGLDPQTAVARFTFGTSELLTGVQLVPVIIGLFALGEILAKIGIGGATTVRVRLRDMLLTRDDWRRSWLPIVRSSLLGFVVGTLPGAGATIASFFGYDIERRLSKQKEKFGRGAIEGVAAPEAANNAAVNGSFVPTLTLGIPGSATTAVILGALLLHGIQPGPFFLAEQSDLAWGLMASFYLGNLALLILNAPLAPFFAMLLRIRYSMLYPGIILISLLGAYAATNSMFAVWMAAFFGLLGLGMQRNGYPAAPLILGLILGGLMEEALRQTANLGDGFLSIVAGRPIALIFGLLAIAVIVLPPLVRPIRRMATSRADV